MVDVSEMVPKTVAPADYSWEISDARDLPSSQPLQNTPERLTELNTETILVQLNDRAPRHLYPKLENRGYTYETNNGDGVVVTVIWRK